HAGEARVRDSAARGLETSGCAQLPRAGDRSGDGETTRGSLVERERIPRCARGGNRGAAGAERVGGAAGIDRSIASDDGALRVGASTATAARSRADFPAVLSSIGATAGVARR